MKNKHQKEVFKKMPSKKDLKVFINEILNGGAKFQRFVYFNSDFIIFTVKLLPNICHFCPSFAKVQSIDNIKGKEKIVYTIDNNLHGFESIINEIDYFRRFPESAIKRNITVI